MSQRRVWSFGRPLIFRYFRDRVDFNQRAGTQQCCHDDTCRRRIRLLEIFLSHGAGLAVAVRGCDVVRRHHYIGIGAAGGFQDLAHARRDVVGLPGNVVWMDDGAVLSARGATGNIQPAISHYARRKGVLCEMLPARIDFRVDDRLL